MSKRDRSILTDAERQAVALIRQIRDQVAAGKISGNLNEPARLAHYVIARYRGHVQLRMSKITSELGVSMKTLQRSFRRTFHMSMKAYQTETRIRFAQYLLSIDPDIKISVVAKQLGYDDPNVFERFFRVHVDASPHAWAEATQSRRTRSDRDPND